MVPLIVVLPQLNFLQLGIMANSLQKLKEILKDPLEIPDAASVEIYHENWIPVTSEDHFSTALFPNITLFAVAGKHCYALAFTKTWPRAPGSRALSFFFFFLTHLTILLRLQEIHRCRNAINAAQWSRRCTTNRHISRTTVAMTIQFDIRSS